ncbi:MAG: hypothetical protein LBO09_05515 [Candidatus Peribacteria bacterium]|nr:hypothetical protein [Candidatus Peribacteria bacterium]
MYCYKIVKRIVGRQAYSKNKTKINNSIHLFQFYQIETKQKQKNMKQFKKISSLFAVCFIASMLGMFSSCDQDEDIVSVPPPVVEESLSLNNPSLRASSGTTVLGLSSSYLTSHYGHVCQHRTFSGWNANSSYELQPNTSNGYPYVVGSFTSLPYQVVVNGNCGVAAYVIARGLGYYGSNPPFSLLSDHANATTRKHNTVVYCQTSMRLHREKPSYNFGIPAIADIHDGIAQGDGVSVSDKEYLTNPTSPTVGSRSNFVDATFSWAKNATGRTAYKNALEASLQRQKPFVTIVKVQTSSHPIKQNGGDQVTLYSSYNWTTNTGNYISTSGGGHYIVIVRLEKVTNSNGDIDGDASKIYYLDPYWDAKVVWETTYHKLVDSAESAGTYYNGFGFL